MAVEAGGVRSGRRSDPTSDLRASSAVGPSGTRTASETSRTRSDRGAPPSLDDGHADHTVACLYRRLAGDRPGSGRHTFVETAVRVPRPGTVQVRVRPVEGLRRGPRGPVERQRVSDGDGNYFTGDRRPDRVVVEPPERVGAGYLSAVLCSLDVDGRARSGAGVPVDGRPNLGVGGETTRQEVLGVVVGHTSRSAERPISARAPAVGAPQPWLRGRRVAGATRASGLELIPCPAGGRIRPHVSIGLMSSHGPRGPAQSSNPSSNCTASPSSSGSFALPQWGDWTQAGHPESQGHSRIIERVTSISDSMSS